MDLGKKFMKSEQTIKIIEKMMLITILGLVIYMVVFFGIEMPNVFSNLEKLDNPAFFTFVLILAVFSILAFIISAAVYFLLVIRKKHQKIGELNENWEKKKL